MKKLGKGTGLKNIKKPNLKEKAPSLLFALLALVLTVIVFGGLLFLRSIFEEEVTYKTVMVAKRDIPENEVITVENAPMYLEMKQMNILDTMNGSMSSADPILGAQTKVHLYQGEIVTEKDFRAIPGNTEEFTDPVEISIEIGDLSAADGGKIRAGDTVNIGMMFTRSQLGLTNSLRSSASSNSLFYIPGTDDADREEETDEDLFPEEETEEREEDMILSEEDLTGPADGNPAVSASGSYDSDYVFDYYAEYILENVYVSKVLDSSGNEISPTDTTSSAGILIFTIEKDRELAINNALANGANIRVSRVIKKKTDNGSVELPAAGEKETPSADTEAAEAETAGTETETGTEEQ